MTLQIVEALLVQLRQIDCNSLCQSGHNRRCRRTQAGAEGITGAASEQQKPLTDAQATTCHHHLHGAFGGHEEYPYSLLAGTGTVVIAVLLDYRCRRRQGQTEALQIGICLTIEQTSVIQGQQTSWVEQIGQDDGPHPEADQRSFLFIVIHQHPRRMGHRAGGATIDDGM